MLKTHLYSISKLVKEVDRFKTFLSSDELEKSERMLDRDKGLAYASCRGLLREVLSHELKIAPEDIEFLYNQYGKPLIKNEEIHFNCSHSKDALLISLDKNYSCGVDIEFVNFNRKVDKLLSKVLSNREIKLYQNINDSQEKILFFYKIWTIKEAITKERGTGIIASLSNIDPKPINDHCYQYEDLFICNKNLPEYTLSLATKDKDALLKINDINISMR